MVGAREPVRFRPGAAQLQHHAAPAAGVESLHQPQRVCGFETAAETVQHDDEGAVAVAAAAPAQVDEIAIVQFDALAPQIDARLRSEHGGENGLQVRVAQQWMRPECSVHDPSIWCARRRRVRGIHAGLKRRRTGLQR